MNKYDGSIFQIPRPCDPGDDFDRMLMEGPSPDRNDLNAIVEPIRAEVAAAIESDDLPEPARQAAGHLLLKCRTVMLGAQGTRTSLGPRHRLTYAALYELGGLHLKFQILANGFEKLAGIGIERETNFAIARQGKPLTEEASRMFDAGLSIRAVAEQAGVSRKVAERWRKLWLEEKQ